MLATLASAMPLGCLAGAVISVRKPAKRVRPEDVRAAGNRWVRLRDGRLLEYSVTGDLSGVPVFCANGYVNTCNIFGSDYFQAIAKKLKLRMIGVSMPGFGLSDSVALGCKRSVLDWPLDVVEVLQKEEVDSFYIFGYSTGGVHGAAIAHAFPDRVLGIMLMSPTAPYHVELQKGNMALPTKLTKVMLQTDYIGDLLAWVLSKLSAEARMNALPDVKLAMQKLLVGGNDHKAAYVHLIEDQNRACAHTYRGFADNMHTVVNNIPFDLAELGKLTRRGIRIGITSSPDDTTTPPAMQQWFHEQIPGSRLYNIDAGYGHLYGVVPENAEKI